MLRGRIDGAKKRCTALGEAYCRWLASTCSSHIFPNELYNKIKIGYTYQMPFALLPFCPGTTCMMASPSFGSWSVKRENEPRLRVTSDPTPSNPRLHSFQRHATRLTPANHVSEAPFILNGRQMASQTGNTMASSKAWKGSRKGARGLCR